MEILVTIIVMILCLIMEAFFSGSEIGVVSADQMKLRHEAAKGSKGAALALKMLKKPEWLLSTTLVGTNIAVVTNTTMATALMITLFGEQYSWLAVVLVGKSAGEERRLEAHLPAYADYRQRVRWRIIPWVV